MITIFSKDLLENSSVITAMMINAKSGIKSHVNMQNLINLHKWSFEKVAGSSSKVEYLYPKGNSDISSLHFFKKYDYDIQLPPR